MECLECCFTAIRGQMSGSMNSMRGNAVSSAEKRVTKPRAPIVSYDDDDGDQDDGDDSLDCMFCPLSLSLSLSLSLLRDVDQMSRLMFDRGKIAADVLSRVFEKCSEFI